MAAPSELTTVLPSRGTRSGAVSLSIVIPCYNEHDVIRTTHERITNILGQRSDIRLQVVYVDDGSIDGTEEIIEELAKADSRVKLLCLSRNFGHQPAVSAGLAHADGDVVVVMDADLQDPPEVVFEMLDKWREGNDVVYGVRTQRKESAFKKFSYSGFYRLSRAVSDIDMPLNAGDFSLMDRRVVNLLNSLPEKNRFIRGLRAWAGFQQSSVLYERALREAGETKYSYAMLLKLAMDGIFNFSTLPLTLVFGVGLITASISALGLVFIVVQRVFYISIFGVSPEDVPGFAALTLTILFLGSIQILSIGIVGEYVGRVYQETKSRPSYVIRKLYWRNPSKEDD